MDSCNGVLRARADTYLPLRAVGVSGLTRNAFFRMWHPMAPMEGNEIEGGNPYGSTHQRQTHHP